MANVRQGVLLLFGSLLLPGIALAQDFAAKGFKVAPTTPRESTPENVAAGKELYEDNCSQCHGAEGDGQGVMADLLDPRPRDFRRAIYKIRRTPQGATPRKSPMPVRQEFLSEEEISQVVAYIYAASGSTPRTWEH